MIAQSFVNTGNNVTLGSTSSVDHFNVNIKFSKISKHVNKQFGDKASFGKREKL